MHRWEYPYWLHHSLVWLLHPSLTKSSTEDGETAQQRARTGLPSMQELYTQRCSRKAHSLFLDKTYVATKPSCLANVVNAPKPPGSGCDKNRTSELLHSPTRILHTLFYILNIYSNTHSTLLLLLLLLLLVLHNFMVKHPLQKPNRMLTLYCSTALYLLSIPHYLAWWKSNDPMKLNRIRTRFQRGKTKKTLEAYRCGSPNISIKRHLF